MNVQRSTLNAQRSSENRGSALIIALWTIALLSLLVMSFALDALLEGRVNLYVRQRRQVDYLTQSGIVIAEMLLLEYRNATASTTTDEKEDRWLGAKLDLQKGEASTGDVVVDAANPDGGVVRVKISAGESSRWPINLLFHTGAGGAQVDKIWENVLTVANVPQEYWEELIDCWTDWVDADNTVTGRNGAERDYYEGLEQPYTARNGPIDTVDELLKVKGFLPAIVNGGVLNPEEKDPKKQIVIRSGGIKAFFDIYGELVKINVNSADKEVLLTVPGIDGDELLAGAIVEERETGSRRVSSAATDLDRESKLFKDWNDLTARIEGIPLTASDFLSYAPEKYFKIEVEGEAGGISHRIEAMAIVEGDKVRYVRWREDP
ncbi:MAG TPA: type II secretion system protein GspK [Kiritimatiellia bacterium]|mgnify:FL=1|nr:type II secretion system protein GspK [Kiritimatiellia bacterium]HOR97823.1 type II secretion system protein GspK [Kiritimatiellia bacterium]HPC48794.1 type II secretion system protein GspK [Kiritimatiellia bacterium]HPK37766.1 type II secretion system protein GspK [Kiritimatiellia bacterium]